MKEAKIASEPSTLTPVPDPFQQRVERAAEAGAGVGLGLLRLLGADAGVLDGALELVGRRP